MFLGTSSLSFVLTNKHSMIQLLTFLTWGRHYKKLQFWKKYRYCTHNHMFGTENHMCHTDSIQVISVPVYIGLCMYPYYKIMFVDTHGKGMERVMQHRHLYHVLRYLVSTFASEPSWFIYARLFSWKFKGIKCFKIDK